MFAWPTRSPTWIAPMLLDFASTVSIGTTHIPAWESWIVRLNSVSLPPLQLIGLSGRRLVVSSAAESVMTLNTEPGSNGTLNGVIHAGLGVLAAFHGNIGVEGGIAGHRQDVAGIGLHHHDAAANSHCAREPPRRFRARPRTAGARRCVSVSERPGLGRNRSLRMRCRAGARR